MIVTNYLTTLLYRIKFVPNVFAETSLKPTDLLDAKIYVHRLLLIFFQVQSSKRKILVKAFRNGYLNNLF